MLLSKESIGQERIDGRLRFTYPRPSDADAYTLLSALAAYAVDVMRATNEPVPEHGGQTSMLCFGDSDNVIGFVTAGAPGKGYSIAYKQAMMPGKRERQRARDAA